MKKPTSVRGKKKLISWLFDHPAFIAPLKKKNGYSPYHLFHPQLYLMWAWVDPKTRRVEDNEERNTHFEVWLEHGCVQDVSDVFDVKHEVDRYRCSHDIELDCGGDNLDEALLNLALKVAEHYGFYNKTDSNAYLKWHRTHENGVFHEPATVIQNEVL